MVVAVDLSNDDGDDEQHEPAQSGEVDLAPFADVPVEARKPRVRARTESMKRLSKRDLERGRLMYPEVDYPRPATRGDCLPGGWNEARPCPFVRCKYALYLDVSASGAVKFNFPHLDPDEIPETCALDVADRGGATLEEVGEFMAIVRERVRQVEGNSLRKLAQLSELAALQDEVE